MTTMSVPVVESRLKEHQSGPCVHCKKEVEWIAPKNSAAPTTTSSSAPTTEAYAVRCASCKETWVIRPPSSSSTAASGGNGAGSGAGSKKGKRRIGTDEKPLDMTYYDLLGLPATCTTEEVKKAYRRLAIKNHPDKNPNDPLAAERFKDIAVAYTTLSDEGLRHTYNEFGKGKGDGQGEDGMVDPESIFSQLFGGERFHDIIGTISLGSEMKSAMQEAEDDEDEEEPATSTKEKASTVAQRGKDGKTALSPEEEEAKRKKKEAKELQEKKQSEQKAKVRAERVKMLVERLRSKLALFTEQAQGEDDEQIAAGVRTMWSIEAEELKQESYGVELLQTVGFVYSSKSKHYLATTGIVPFGVAGWFHSAKSAAHIVGQTVSTVRSAYALKEVFDQLAAAEKSGLSDEKRKEWEDKAAQMGLQALFKGAKLEVESIIREVCDVLLTENEPVSVLRKRAVALGLLGEQYENVKKDENSNPPIGGMPGMGPGGVPPSFKP